VTSPAKVAANRENARRSTGLRTPAGKRAARRNALKHGLLAQEVLLASENARDLEELARRLRAALRPADDLEALLVDRVVSCAWDRKEVLAHGSAPPSGAGRPPPALHERPSPTAAAQRARATRR